MKKFWPKSKAHSKSNLSKKIPELQIFLSNMLFSSISKKLGVTKRFVKGLLDDNNCWQTNEGIVEQVITDYFLGYLQVSVGVKNQCKPKEAQIQTSQ